MPGTDDNIKNSPILNDSSNELVKAFNDKCNELSAKNKGYPNRQTAIEAFRTQQINYFLSLPRDKRNEPENLAALEHTTDDILVQKIRVSALLRESKPYPLSDEIQSLLNDKATFTFLSHFYDRCNKLRATDIKAIEAAEKVKNDPDATDKYNKAIARSKAVDNFEKQQIAFFVSAGNKKLAQEIVLKQFNAYQVLHTANIDTTSTAAQTVLNTPVLRDSLVGFSQKYSNLGERLFPDDNQKAQDFNIKNIENVVKELHEYNSLIIKNKTLPVREQVDILTQKSAVSEQLDNSLHDRLLNDRQILKKDFVQALHNQITRFSNICKKLKKPDIKAAAVAVESIKDEYSEQKEAAAVEYHKARKKIETVNDFNNQLIAFFVTEGKVDTDETISEKFKTHQLLQLLRAAKVDTTSPEGKAALNTPRLRESLLNFSKKCSLIAERFPLYEDNQKIEEFKTKNIQIAVQSLNSKEKTPEQKVAASEKAREAVLKDTLSLVGDTGIGRACRVAVNALMLAFAAFTVVGLAVIAVGVYGTKNPSLFFSTDKSAAALAHNSKSLNETFRNNKDENDKSGNGPQ